MACGLLAWCDTSILECKPGLPLQLSVIPAPLLHNLCRMILKMTHVHAEAVGTSPSELTQGLQEHTYTTKTRGERLQPGARPAGDGTYVIAKGGSRNGTHLG